MKRFNPIGNVYIENFEIQFGIESYKSKQAKQNLLL